MELALIGYLLLKYGLKVTNKSIYPMHIYQNIPAGLEIFDVQSHGALEENMVGTIHLIRRAIFIGTAPPRRTLQNPNYAESLRVWQHPFKPAV
jgi:hypothetical protein